MCFGLVLAFFLASLLGFSSQPLNPPTPCLACFSSLLRACLLRFPCPLVLGYVLWVLVLCIYLIRIATLSRPVVVSLRIPCPLALGYVLWVHVLGIHVVRIAMVIPASCSVMLELVLCVYVVCMLRLSRLVALKLFRVLRAVSVSFVCYGYPGQFHSVVSWFLFQVRVEVMCDARMAYGKYVVMSRVREQWVAYLATGASPLHSLHVAVRTLYTQHTCISCTMCP